jgi:hypothetical protein
MNYKKQKPETLIDNRRKTIDNRLSGRLMTDDGEVEARRWEFEYRNLKPTYA